MTRLACVLGVALVTTWSVTGIGAGLFDEKLSNDRQVVHALNRLTFGPRPGDVERVRRLGVERWIRSQLELVVSAVRALDAEVVDAWTLSQRIAELGQPLYGKAEPTGYPNTSEAWANSAGFLGRINFASALVSGEIDGLTVNTPAGSTSAATIATRLLGTRPAAGTLALYERRSAAAASPAALAAVLLGSPDFQRR